MSFVGSQDKCKACTKTVHFAEMMSADGVPYHNTCFRCSNCNGRLLMSNYFSIEGTLYCKPHFEQLLKENGSYSKKLPTDGKPNELARAPSKVSSMFCGTQDKCAVCKKTVYPIEKVTMEGEFFHKACFRCAHGGCFLTTSSYAALDGVLYCKPHFSQLFKQNGCYNNFTKTTLLKNNPTTPPPEGEGEIDGQDLNEEINQEESQPEPEQLDESKSI